MTEEIKSPEIDPKQSERILLANDRGGLYERVVERMPPPSIIHAKSSAVCTTHRSSGDKLCSA